MNEVVIYGAGGLGCQVQDILLQAAKLHPVAFLDSDPARHSTQVGGLPVLGGLEQVPLLLQRNIRHVIVAIGDNLTRAAHAETLQAHGMELASAIHPLATISPSARIAEHVIIDARATVCVHSVIQRHTILSAGAIAEHDTQLGVGVFLGPAVRLAGGVQIDDFARLEIGASVIPGRAVGTGACVEAGTIVIHNIPANTTVRGAPATLASTAP